MMALAMISANTNSKMMISEMMMISSFLRLLRFRKRKNNEAMKSVSSMPMSLGAGGDSGLL